jgi:hypothetical protein
MFFAYSNGITATAQSVETATTEFGLAQKKRGDCSPRPSVAPADQWLISE